MMRSHPGMLVFLLCCLALCLRGFAQQADPPFDQQVTQGALRVKTADGGVVECPLKHTDVKAEISGYLAQATVTQTFVNPYDEKIEAVYVFPLPHTAAVVDMTMVVGDKRIIGVIKRRDEARQVYEQAIQRGQTASLLEQERPNIFTQTVGNIKPHAEVRIEITYFDVLKYDGGVYEFHFPMVIAPRYIPGKATSATPTAAKELQGTTGVMPSTTAVGSPSGAGWSPDTDSVPDASRITPPVLKPGFRTGHDISLSVELDAGVPIQNLRVVNHKANMQRRGEGNATITLSPADAVPNKDFVLRYYVKGEKPEMALLTHSKGSGEGYFMLMMQPGVEDKLSREQPREIIFTIDVSGSMQNEPTEKVKEIMRKFLALSRPTDTIQVVTFSDSASKLFDKPVPATPEHVAEALNYTQSVKGWGGTEMLGGLNLALNEPQDPSRMRMVVLFTDGDVGNEREVMHAVEARSGDQLRVSSIGIGQSPNRYLIDGIAKAGQGLSGVVELGADPSELVEQIVTRLHHAQLSDIRINWNGLSVSDVYPRRIPDLWTGKPVTLFGRYFEGGSARITLTGKAEGEVVRYPLDIALPDDEANHSALAPVWARQKIEDLSMQMNGGDIPEVVEEITKLALKYRLMSQYTSFVAVDESDIDQLTEPAAPPRRMVVAVPLPEGMSFAGVFGEEEFVGAQRDNADSTAGDELLLDNVQMDALGALTASAVTSTQVVKTKALSQTSITATAMTTATYSASGKMVNAPAPSIAVKRTAASRVKYNASAVNANSVAVHSTVRQAQMQPPSPKSPSKAQAAAKPNGRPVVTPLLGVAVLAAVAAAPPSPGTGGGGAAGPSGLVSMPNAEVVPREGKFTAEVFGDWGKPRAVEATSALSEAQALLKATKLDEALRQAQLAYFLELAARAFQPNQHTEQQADILKTLAEVTDAIAKQHATAAPIMTKKLEVVVRDQSLQQALDTMATAAGITITIVPGSLEDAAALAGTPEARVDYLDLRHATVAQALDWVLAPAHLDWSVEVPNHVTIGSARRLPGASPWVYVIGELVSPTKEELAKKDQVAMAKTALAELLAGVRSVLGQQQDGGLQSGSAVLIDVSRLLVYGTPTAHARVAALLAALKDPAVDMKTMANGELTDQQYTALQQLHTATALCWTAGMEARRQHQESVERRRVLNILVSSSWPLLAQAGRGTATETLTALQSAWRSPLLKELTKSNNWAVMRSAWAITQAARDVPKDAELSALTDTALAEVYVHLPVDMAELQKRPGDQATYYSLLYAVLARRNADALRKPAPDDYADTTAQAIKLLVTGPKIPLRIVAASLLAPTPETDASLKSLIVEHKLTGNDLIVLAQRAAEQRGGNLQKAFREELPALTANQRLNGHVIVYVNR